MRDYTGRNIVVFCDGSGQDIGELSEGLSNVLKLYRCVRKTEKTAPRQIVFYTSGVGTQEEPDPWQPWQRLRQALVSLLGLTTGYGLDDNLLASYQFLANNWQAGDNIYLFGFSRGAYTVRVLAGLLHKVGLLSSEQLNLATRGITAYKRSYNRAEELLPLGHYYDEDAPVPAQAYDRAAQFARILGARWAPVHFVGVWDTVASVFVPRPDRFYIPRIERLAYTQRNPSVKIFRQAVSIDERRRMYRLLAWDEPQIFMRNPFMPIEAAGPQDTMQVWFPGVHSDIGGGYPEKESGLSKYPLLWMIDEAVKSGLSVNPLTVNQLAWGRSRKHSPINYVAPDFSREAHDSMTGGWPLLEFMPKSDKSREWQSRQSWLGFYLPRSEPRPIPEGAIIHVSALKRMDVRPDYRPINLPRTYKTFEMPTPPSEYVAE